MGECRRSGQIADSYWLQVHLNPQIWNRTGRPFNIACQYFVFKEVINQFSKASFTKSGLTSERKYFASAVRI
ncbi:unnamed protein product [Allacma fusca]|uniref:Uncharacterized protein n=1 Tax=Allacma fusca TaxID=39272 RepID=A0A8J2PJM6_9HEXA|nr:unnamed protein product [Allacma fusca]